MQDAMWVWCKMQCDARVLENERHNHYMCAKIGQSKFLRQTSIVRFYTRLRKIFFDNTCKISIILRKYRTNYCPISHNCWYLLYIDTSNVNNEQLLTLTRGGELS